MGGDAFDSRSISYFIAWEALTKTASRRVFSLFNRGPRFDIESRFLLYGCESSAEEIKGDAVESAQEEGQNYRPFPPAW